MPEVELRRLGQGSWIRTRSRGGSGRVETRSSKMETKVVGGRDTRWKFLRRSLGHEDVWVGVLVLHGV